MASDSTSGTPDTPETPHSTPESVPTVAFEATKADTTPSDGTTAEFTPEHDHDTAATPARHVSRFAAWRWRRPFWGGVVLTFAGVVIMATMLQGSLDVALASGVTGVAGYVLPGIMILCGLLLLFSPAQRIFYSIVGLLASLGSWATSNMGAFMVGTVIGVIGSTMAFGWLPEQGHRRQPVRNAVRRKRGKPTQAAN